MPYFFYYYIILNIQIRKKLNYTDFFPTTPSSGEYSNNK